MTLIFELYTGGSVHIPFSLLQHRGGRISQLFFVFISLTLERGPGLLLRFFSWISLNKTDFLATENPSFAKVCDNLKEPSFPHSRFFFCLGGWDRAWGCFPPVLFALTLIRRTFILRQNKKRRLSCLCCGRACQDAVAKMMHASSGINHNLSRPYPEELSPNLFSPA